MQLPIATRRNRMMYDIYNNIMCVTVFMPSVRTITVYTIVKLFVYVAVRCRCKYIYINCSANRILMCECIGSARIM